MTARRTLCSRRRGDPPCWSHLFEDTRADIVDRDDIERLVRNFYRDAAMDDVLGPVFQAARVNWHAHVETLIEFWAWQLLGSPGYDGQPLRAHEPVHARTPLAQSHYARWIELFCDTVDRSFQGPRAEIAKGRGRRWRRPWNVCCRRVGQRHGTDRTDLAARRRVVRRPAPSLLRSNLGCRCERSCEPAGSLWPCMGRGRRRGGDRTDVHRQ